MGINAALGCLSPVEEAFLQALLWEEGHLLKGPATPAAEEQGLSLLRCLEPANRLSPNLHGEALNRLRESACPAAAWPWDKLPEDWQEGTEVAVDKLFGDTAVDKDIHSTDVWMDEVEAVALQGDQGDDERLGAAIQEIRRRETGSYSLPIPATMGEP